MIQNKRMFSNKFKNKIIKYQIDNKHSKITFNKVIKLHLNK